MAKVKLSSVPKFNKQKRSPSKRGNVKSIGIKKQPGRKRRRRGFQKKTKRDPKGVVYICHIPHGFYEEQIEAYFSQFGKVTGVNVPRSKSGRAKGYAFIEYKYPEIAQIAADTMNNYLMMNRLLKAKYIPPDKQKPRIFHMAKVARENQDTLAKKTELAIKHSRKVKNRPLKMSLEVRVIKALLGKKKLLAKRLMDSGLSPDFEVEEANYQSVLQRKEELDALKKNKSNNDEPMSESEEETEDSDENWSFQSDDDLSEDDEEEDYYSESDEDKSKSIFKAKEAARDILKKSAKSKKPKKQLEVKPPRKSLLVVDTKNDENKTPTRLRARKSLVKNVFSLIEKTPQSGKKSRAELHTPKGKKSNVSQTVIEVDNKIEEEISKMSPGGVKKIVNPGKHSAKKIPKEKVTSPISPNKPKSSKKTPKRVKSPKELSSPTLKPPSEKKMRHRKLKYMLNAQ